MVEHVGLDISEVGLVENSYLTLRDFALSNGVVMPEVTLAYETYGQLAPHATNAILVTHGFTSSHHAAGRNPANDHQPGFWHELIGPGKAIDTRRFFVVSSNMLGSAFGSTNAASVDPATGRPYGPDFPAITLRDIVAAQKRLLDALGVRRLAAVAGPSYGGYQAFQWSVAYPDFVAAIAAVNTAPWASLQTAQKVAEVTATLARDPDWHDGRYHGRGVDAGPRRALTAIRIETLKRYGVEASLAAHYPDPAARDARIGELAARWAHTWDAHSLIILRRALIGFDARPCFGTIKARVLYVLCRSDQLFPPSIAPEVMQGLTAAGVAARYVELDSDLGHSSSGPAHAQWSPALRELLANSAHSGN
ncbi:MAG: alpha/beta fold hydrolase [Polyangiales bacterium]